MTNGKMLDAGFWMLDEEPKAKLSRNIRYPASGIQYRAAAAGLSN